MARMKLKQLRDADVRYISLVDRAATRIPFRVLKRDKENEMGIDLTSVFKSDDTGKPYVSALVVFAQKDEAVGAQIQEAIEAHGFSTEQAQKADDGETVMYPQSNQTGETQLVRLSEQMLVSVSGLKTPTGWIGDFVEEHGFLPDMKIVNPALHDHMVTVAKSDTPQEDAQAVLNSYGEYLGQMLVLPSACFKLDEAINEIIQKCSCEETKEEVVKEETPEEKAKRLKNHPPAEMAPKDEEDDQKPPPEEVNKSDEAILSALKDFKESTASQLTGLIQKLETVATEQAAQKKVLDDVVQKADNFGVALKTTVTAPPVAPDRPGRDTQMRIQKKDDDPRTGTFDTAFLRRRR